MKKMTRKLFTGMMALIMCIGTVGCGGNTGDGSSNDNSVDVNQQLGVTNPYELKVFNFGGGYGREWLDTLITRYKRERAGKEFVVDGVTYDGVDFNVESEKVMMETIVTNGVPYDIVFQEQVWYNKFVRQGNVFSPMTEVLTTPNPYENGVTIESKLSKEQQEFYKVDTNSDGEGDTYYGLPHYAGYVGLIYNKNMFEINGWYFMKDYDKDDLENATTYCFTKDLDNRTPGPDGIPGNEDDGLPTTYEEFYALCKVISANYTPLSWTGKYRQEYLNWFITALTANYEGLEQMSLNYNYNGTAKNLISVSDNGTVASLDDQDINGAENGYELAKQAGKYYALSFLEKIADEGWYTAGSAGDTYEQSNAQRDFIRGVENEKNRAAMLVEGVWWEMEADGIFEEIQQTLGRNDKDRYGWMPLPCATEEQAQKRATALKNGGNGYTLMDTHNTLAFLSHKISAGAKEIAIDFLQFAYTDESLAEFSKITDTTKALKYTMSDADKAQMSGFGRSLVSMKERSDLVYGFSNQAFYQLNEETFTDYKNMYSSRYTEDSTDEKIAFDEFRKGVSAKKYFDGLYFYQKNLWNSGGLVK